MLNDAAYDYMRNHGLPAATIALLKAEPQTRFGDQTAWLAHLDRLGFNALKVTPDRSGRHRGRVVGQRSGARIPVRCRRVE